MSNLEEFEKDFGVLVETGFVAVKQGDEDSATKLFQAAKMLKPEHSAPELGMGYISLSKLELQNATQSFENVVKKENENYLAKTFLGLSLMLAKTDEKRGEELVNESLAKSDDPSVIQFAKTVLEWKVQFFEKETNPATSGKE